MSERVTIARPPRIQPALPIEAIKIPRPPARESAALSRLIQLALPLLTLIGAASVSLTTGAGRSPWALIPMALSVCGASGFSLYSYLRERREQAARERAYASR